MAFHLLWCNRPKEKSNLEQFWSHHCFFLLLWEFLMIIKICRVVKTTFSGEVSRCSRHVVFWGSLAVSFLREFLCSFYFSFVIISKIKRALSLEKWYNDPCVNKLFPVSRDKILKLFMEFVSNIGTS